MPYPALTSLPMFQGLSEDDLRPLSNCAEQSAFAEGTAVFDQGDRARLLYILLAGRVEIRYKPHDGKALTVAVIEPNGVFGWSAALGRKTYSSSAVCAGPSRVVMIPGDCLRGLCQASPETGLLVLERLAEIVAGRVYAAKEPVLGMLHVGVGNGEITDGSQGG